ncbi:MAG TPA: electron transfer flavoprotein subunit alpha/FixB family protein [Gemmatimonadales bacterium]|nr:electron transfer flavoprotein subunit alpha/FixB family protein [Gemmatimonadales bacterium]
MSGVLAVLEQRDGVLRKVSFEVATAARRVGTKVDAVVCSSPGPEACATAIAERAKSGGYGVVVFAATATGKDLAPRVAAKLGVAVASDVTDLAAEGDAIVATRPVYAGKALQKIRVLGKPAVVSVRPNIFTPDARASQEKPETLSVASPGRVVVREIKAAPAGMLDVAEAQVIISGGRGLKEPANFKVLEDLAKAFGGRAAVGASRAVVDAGWRPHADQVGQTGKTVSPSLYFAIGISGAIQHLAGMRTSKVIVAINKDKDAPIFKVADYGVVGDLFEIVPKLTDEIRKLHG